MTTESLDQVSDEAMLVLYANGDPQAARLLTQRLAPRAFAFAMRLLGDGAEAEDVVQEAMLRLWRIAAEWRQGEAKISTWLYRVVVNLATDRLRARKRRPAIAIDEQVDPASDAPTAEACLIDRDRMTALQHALLALPERQRQAVILRHIEGLSNPEIAAVMEIGVEAVESLTARGKRALANALAGRREELGYEDAE